VDTAILRDQNCFCCGRDNAQGLKLVFAYPEEGRAQTECLIPEYFTGWRNITHGGFLAMLLDETMAHACLSRATAGVTVEMTVRYVKPVATGETVRVSAEVTGARGRIIEVRGSISGGGEIIARANARFLQVG